MFLVREVLHCKPGKVGALRGKFQALNEVMEGMDLKPFRLLTDASGVRFWTLMAEMEAETLDGFYETEEKVMANEDARRVMDGYHDLIEQGRREIYRIV